MNLAPEAGVSQGMVDVDMKASLRSLPHALTLLLGFRALFLYMHEGLEITDRLLVDSVVDATGSGQLENESMLAHA